MRARDRERHGRVKIPPFGARNGQISLSFPALAGTLHESFRLLLAGVSCRVSLLQEKDCVSRMIVCGLNILGTSQHSLLSPARRRHRIGSFCGLILLLPAVAVQAATVTEISAGVYHSLFVRSDGSLWGMGGDPHGQLGDGTYIERHIPVQVVPPPQILSVDLSGVNFAMSFMTVSSQSYTVQANLDLTTTNWFACTNFSGNGLIMPVAVPVSNGVPQEFFRVKEP